MFSVSGKRLVWKMSEFNIQVILDEIEKYTPEIGFNLCSIDDFEPPGEQLALLGHFDTMEEAQKAQEKYGKEKTVIYYKKK